MNSFKKILGFLIVALGVSHIEAQTALNFPTVGELWQQPEVFVPASPTAVTTSDSLFTHMHLANTTASSVTVTLTDNSTNCGGSPCTFWPAITLAANAVQEVDFGVGGMLCTGGIKWSASTASAVVGWLKGSYVRTQIAMNERPQVQHKRWANGLLTMFKTRRPPGRPPDPQPEVPTLPVGPLSYP